MPFLTAHSPDELVAATFTTVERLCAVAFAADCRLAIRWRLTSIVAMMCEYEFVLLSPGELPPAGEGWEVWENHSGRHVGRAV